MKQIARTAYCLMTLIALSLCLPLMAQSSDDSKSPQEPVDKDGVITTTSMEEIRQAVESDGSVITTTKMKERLEATGEGGTVITNNTLAEPAPAPASGAFTNEHLGTKDDGELADGETDGDIAAPEGGEADADTDATPGAELDRLIGEIEAELDGLAVRIKELEGDSSEARLRETESRIEELRKAVEALKKSD